MKPYAPPPPPGAQPPPLWGDENHVRTLLGSRVVDLDVRRQQLTVDKFGDAQAFVDYFKSNYGPVIATFRANAATRTGWPRWTRPCSGWPAGSCGTGS